MNSDWEAYYLNQISELSSELYDAREVLKILKDKLVDIAHIKSCDDEEEYNQVILDELTEQEFNLIKKWLES